MSSHRVLFARLANVVVGAGQGLSVGFSVGVAAVLLAWNLSMLPLLR